MLLLYPLMGQALSQVYKKRFAAADTILMHPSTWWWIASSLDGQSRPLVIPAGGAGLNTVAVLNPMAAEGIAGSIAGVPVVVDANVPNNLGRAPTRPRWSWAGSTTRGCTSRRSGSVPTQRS